MKLIVGLGNAGEKYSHSRHNTGFMFADELVSDIGGSFVDKRDFIAKIYKSGDFLVVKPQTMMNDSGRTVRKIIDFFGLTAKDLCLVHDDLDIKLGEYKIHNGRGPKEHNGVNSVEEWLGSTDFQRIRIGVDNRDPLMRLSGEIYVLQNFSESELEVIRKVIKAAINEIKQ